jgi:competence protein ComEA
MDGRTDFPVRHPRAPGPLTSLRMTRGETQATIRGTILLVAVGTLRVWLSAPPSEPSVPGQKDDLPGILAESASSLSEVEARRKPLAPGERLDPNRASELELDRLPGVGPSLARSIVEHRESEGGFVLASDLLSVRGLGPASLLRIQPFLDLTLGPPPSLRPSVGGRRARERSRVALNSASIEDLQSVSGIGPVLAKRIMDHRRLRGRFSSLDDLLEVPGIGPRTLERIRARFRVDGRVP